MQIEEYNFILTDRITKIKSIDNQYNLEKNSYLSFSGGLDSTVLHHLLDKALPNNRIPRVFMNTGIEYVKLVEFVKGIKDDRIEIRTPKKSIRNTLEEVGYPFKSKQHSLNLSVYQNSGMTKTNINYLGKGTKETFLCPNCLKYQFSEDFKIKVSDRCCFEFKKKPFKDYQEETNRNITLTAMRKEEGGYRNNLNCVITDKERNLIKFHPLAVVGEDFIKAFIEFEQIEICELYKAPFNFKRTGCKGCPFALDLQKQLDVMADLLPSEKKACEVIWKPIYDEYRRIGYRLKQKTLFED